jgi:hypothetical protein
MLVATIIFLLLFISSIALWRHYDGKGEGWDGIPWFCLSGLILASYGATLLVLWLRT